MMNSHTKRAVYVGLGLCFLTAAILASLAEKANITASEDIWLRSQLMGGKSIYLLKAGSNVPIAKCIDIKSYIIYRVLLPDGRIAYLDSGHGIVEVRSMFSKPFNQPTVWNCF